MSKTNNHQLFADFRPSSLAEWEQQVAKDLKTEDWRSKLVWHSPEGFDVPPFFTETSSGMSALADHATLNTEQPALGVRHWFNVQKIKVKEEKTGNTLALKALNSGADGILFQIGSSSPRLKLEILLADILPQFCWIGFERAGDQGDLTNQYLDFLAKHKVDSSLANGIFLNDVIANWSISGKKIETDFWNKAVTSIQKSSKNLPLLCVDTRHFHNTGGSIVQELAFGLSVATEYIHQLTERGIEPQSAIKAISISLAIGGSYFMEMAKIRATRVLVKQLATAYGLDDFNLSDLKIHSSSSTWNKTFLEPYTNMLRNTTEAMSAILGGCNSLCIDAFDEGFRDSANNSQRWSRNVSTILKEESYFDKVADPAAGSYYINQLTDSLVHHAWQLFQEIEAQGGYIQAFENGQVQQRLATSRAEKLKRINHRKQVLVGGNQFSLGIEKPDSLANLQLGAHLIYPQRALQDFEQIRLNMLRYIEIHGEANTPGISLISLSNSSMAQARKDFATDFFQTGGFKVADIDKAQASQVAVICGSDDDYLALSTEQLAGLKKKYTFKLWVLAGQPSNKEELSKSGIDHFIFMNAHVPSVLGAIQNQIFAKP